MHDFLKGGTITDEHRQTAVSQLTLHQYWTDKWKEFLALIVGAGLYTVLNYFGQRFFAFAEKKKSAVQSETAVTDIEDTNRQTDLSGSENDGEEK